MPSCSFICLQVSPLTPSFLFLPLLLHCGALRRPYTVDAGGLLSSGIPGGCLLRAGQKWRGLGISLERESWGDAHLFTITGQHPLCPRQWERGWGHALSMCSRLGDACNHFCWCLVSAHRIYSRVLSSQGPLALYALRIEQFEVARYCCANRGVSSKGLRASTDRC